MEKKCYDERSLFEVDKKKNSLLENREHSALSDEQLNF